MLEPGQPLLDLGAAARVVVDNAVAPCAVAGAAMREGNRWRIGFGVAGRLWAVPPARVGGPAPAAEAATLFDLASLTKPLTALVLARLCRSGVVARRDELASCIPALVGTPVAQTTLDLLSAHRAGLEAHREFFRAAAEAVQPGRDAILGEAAAALRPGCEGAQPEGGFPPVYSDLGYILLGAALEARTGMPLDALVDAHVARPLGARLGSVRTLGPEGLDPRQVAATELVPWRGGVLSGLVHDENAFVLAGRALAGHAGAFGDCEAVMRLGVAILDALSGRHTEWLGPVDLQPCVRRRPGGTLCAGFDRRAASAPLSGSHFGPETFGHLGFTGTSLWIDPERELVGVLLSNRVHPSRYIAGTARPPAVAAARRAAYDLMFAGMTGEPPRK